jgi:hypothetical protein
MKWLALVAAHVAVWSVAVHAQQPSGMSMNDTAATPAVTWMLGAEAIGVVTRQSPAEANRAMTEGYLSQPMLMGMLSAAGGRLGLDGMLDFEGLTLKRGELNAGMEGEGYVDRRHPHTYLHELVGSAQGSVAETQMSVAVGKGFVPFGTDDPMVRPFEKYPANHHLSQIVERLLAGFAVRRGPVIIEAARFNGDEPESPSDLPNSNRLWDSWSMRATVIPISVLELQGSAARVKSPEIASGGGLDQRKVSLSLRYESSSANTMKMPGEMDSTMDMGPRATAQWNRYGLVEWGRTGDYAGSTKAFSFNTALAEGEIENGRVAFAARLERTERPEDERLANPFRTVRPGTDFSILGRTRWDIATVRASATTKPARMVSFTPFIEIARQHAVALTKSAVFDPRQFYGSSSMWSFSGGLTITAGMIHRRTGRYGVR